jgi:hypothetical protein
VMNRLLSGTVLLAGVLILAGCTDDSKNPLSGAVSSPMAVINASVAGVTSQEFTVGPFAVAKTGASSNYLYGVAEFTYTGSQTLNYIEAIITIRGTADQVLAKDTTYLRNTTCISTKANATRNTNTFVNSAHPKVYYMFIKELALNPGSFKSAVFEIKADTAESFAPQGILSLAGAPYISVNETCQNFSNSGTERVNVEFSRFIFQNSTGVSYLWTFPDVYIKSGTGYIESDIFNASDEGRLGTVVQSVAFESGSFTLKASLLSWDPAIVLPKEIRSIASADTDVRNCTMRSIMDQQDRQHK